MIAVSRFVFPSKRDSWSIFIDLLMNFRSLLRRLRIDFCWIFDLFDWFWNEFSFSSLSFSSSLSHSLSLSTQTSTSPSFPVLSWPIKRPSFHRSIWISCVPYESFTFHMKLLRPLWIFCVPHESFPFRRNLLRSIRIFCVRYESLAFHVNLLRSIWIFCSLFRSIWVYCVPYEPWRALESFAMIFSRFFIPLPSPLMFKRPFRFSLSLPS